MLKSQYIFKVVSSFYSSRFSRSFLLHFLISHQVWFLLVEAVVLALSTVGTLDSWLLISNKCLKRRQNDFQLGFCFQPLMFSPVASEYHISLDFWFSNVPQLARSSFDELSKLTKKDFFKTNRRGISWKLRQLKTLRATWKRHQLQSEKENLNHQSDISKFTFKQAINTGTSQIVIMELAPRNWKRSGPTAGDLRGS